jgi:hypothetical protein
LKAHQYTEEAHARADVERKGMARYWEFADPKVLDQMSVDAIQAKRGELGDEVTNRLLAQKHQPRAVTIDRDTFLAVAASGGLDAYSPKTDEQKSTLGLLHSQVETAVQLEQDRLGRKLKLAEEKAIATEIVDRKVLIDNNYIRQDPARVASLVTNPTDRERAYVPLDKIPPAALTEALNFARSINPRVARMNDAQLKALYSNNLQKAYALSLMGASRAEVEAAIKGSP